MMGRVEMRRSQRNVTIEIGNEPTYFIETSLEFFVINTRTECIENSKRGLNFDEPLKSSPSFSVSNIHISKFKKRTVNES